MSFRSLYESFKRIGLLFFKIFTTIWFIVHFSLTFLFNAPLNPIKVRLNPLLDLTIGSFFSQNWSLFAPNPVSQDFILLVQPRRDSLKDQSTANEHEWYNLSTPLWNRFQKKRFSAFDRLARSQSNSLRTALMGNPNMIGLFKACENNDSIACSNYDALLKSVQDKEIDKLVRISSSFCNELKDKNDFKGKDFLAIRIRIKSFSPWSRRYEKEITIKDVNLGTYPIDRSVVPMGLFN